MLGDDGNAGETDERRQLRYSEPMALLIGLAVAMSATFIAAEFGFISSKTALGASVLAAIAASLSALLNSTTYADSGDGGAAHSSRNKPVSTMSPSTILAAIPDPALLLDGSATIVHSNGAAERLFGKALDGLALERVSRDPELLTAVEEAKAHGERTIARFEQFTSVERHLMATVSPIVSDRAGESDTVLVIIRDLSDQHRMLEMRTDFIANASHELRTPLASVPRLHRDAARPGEK